MSEPVNLRRETHFSNRVIRCFADRPASLFAKLETVFLTRVGHVAVVDEHRRLTYRDLDERVRAAASFLWARGVRAGGRVVAVVPNRAEFVVVVLAALRLGAVAVPVNIREATPEITYIMKDCGASGLVFDPDCAAAAATAEALASPVWSATIAELWNAPQSDDHTLPDKRAEDATVCIVYTSGTTGLPKGAMLSDLGILHSMMHYEHHLGLSADDTAVLVVPATHITGLIGLIMASLGVGAKLVMLERFSTAEFVRTAAREGMSYTIMVPAMYNLILLREDLSAHSLSRWRIAAYGGSVMPQDSIETLARLLPGLNLVNAYGATETTSPTSLMPLGSDPSRFDSVGRPVACAEVLIMDDDGHECPPGATGEIWIRGPMVVSGYWNRPAENTSDFVAGFWRSGDIGELTDDGYLKIFDRKKDLVNRGGYKIFSAEVENILIKHPDVTEVAVVGRPDPILGERVHAFVSTQNPEISAEILRDYCARELADYKVPETFTFMAASLPRNANGKLMKRELKGSIG